MTNYFASSDDELLSAFKRGDKAAFKMLYERYWQLLYVSACKVIKDEEEAKDVVQEVFISLLNKGTELNISTSLANYLYTATRYKVLDRISRSKVRSNYIESLENHISTSGHSSDRALIEKEINAQITKEVQNLPEKMKEIFELSRNANLSHREIAERLNISDKTVKKQINNAIKLLKPKFTGYYSLAIVIFFKLF